MSIRLRLASVYLLSGNTLKSLDGSGNLVGLDEAPKRIAEEIGPQVLKASSDLRFFYNPPDERINWGEEWRGKGKQKKRRVK